MFAKVEYGEGTRPMCRFMLDTPVDTGIMNGIFRVDAQISEDMSTFYVWFVNRENGRVLYNAIRKRLPEEYRQSIESVVNKVVSLTKQQTLKNREANYASNAMIQESVRKSLDKYFGRVDEHLDVVNNLNLAIRIIKEQWQSPDDCWWIKIEQRFKDFRHYNTRHGFSEGQKGFKRWRRVDGPDGTSRENHVGYVIVKGDTLEDCIKSLTHAVVNLNPWAQHMVDTGKTQIGQSNGNMEQIIQVCNRFFARAYMTINHRSYQAASDRAEQDKKEGKFKGRELHHRIGQTKTGFDGTVDWSKERPWGMTDCDVDNVDAQAELERYHDKQGVKPFDAALSHDGKHYIFNTLKPKDFDYSFMQRHNSFNRRNDPNCEFKPDASIIVYSAVGV